MQGGSFVCSLSFCIIPTLFLKLFAYFWHSISFLMFFLFIYENSSVCSYFFLSLSPRWQLEHSVELLAKLFSELKGGRGGTFPQVV